jgi:hypothetical protein
LTIPPVSVIKIRVSDRRFFPATPDIGMHWVTVHHLNHGKLLLFFSTDLLQIIKYKSRKRQTQRRSIMRKKIIISLLFLVCFVMNLPAYSEPYYVQNSIDAHSADKTMSAVPAVVIKESRFEFEPVIEGTEIIHDFVIGNQGEEPLIIEKIRTSCGCTTAYYAKSIPPGAEGKISVKGNTRGYGGRKFTKSVIVYTNDPSQKQFNLYISGDIDQFALIHPEHLVLRGAAGNQLKSVVSITPKEKYPFKILETYSELSGKKIEFSLKKKDGRYLLTVSNLMKTSGNYRGKIHLKTDNPVQPEIIIYVSGIIA